MGKNEDNSYIAYEIRERLVAQWLVPQKAKGRGKLVGLQFEFRDSAKKKRPLLPYLRVRQVYGTSRSTRLSLVSVAKDKVRRRGHVYAAGDADPLPDKDLPKKRLYERLEYCGDAVPDFVFFSTEDLRYLADRYEELFLSGSEAMFGASFGQEALPNTAPNLKIEGGDRLQSSASRSGSSSTARAASSEGSAPEAQFGLGWPCPPRWYIDE